MIGTAQAMAVLTYAGLRISFGQNKLDALGEGIIANILPQLEGLTRDRLSILADFSSGNYEALFITFEDRILNRVPTAQDLKNLQQISRYLEAHSTGTAKRGAAAIAEAAASFDDASRHQLESFLTGTDDTPGWRDLFSKSFKGPVLNHVAETLKEMADEVF